ncbi:hypothetical protein [Pseudomonas sp. RIT-PI-S]|uniref:hypothetical protein n=1 Tax=Pseudomonas sp. RIT-PI-S TaxID=3035295 RepID=UPI0021D88E51|nr:hypothetical protein [Pseudomonas sp. RIT-PI-S]
MIPKSMRDFSNVLTTPGFFEAVFSGVDDWDVILDERDAGDFDESWVLNNEALKLKPCSDKDEEALNKLREYVFKEVFRITKNSEVSSYASDDIDLIGQAIAKNEITCWVLGLFDAYRSGVFPS